MAFIKPIKEKGIVISKEYKEAKPARKDLNGKDWPATAEKYLVEVISCDAEDFDKVNGILNGTRVSYPVDKNTYDRVKFGMWANVKFEVSQFGDKMQTKPLSFVLID